eukprot:3944931-Prymnesium_polylepis.1
MQHLKAVASAGQSPHQPPLRNELQVQPPRNQSAQAHASHGQDARAHVAVRRLEPARHRHLHSRWRSNDGLGRRRRQCTWLNRRWRWQRLRWWLEGICRLFGGLIGGLHGQQQLSSQPFVGKPSAIDVTIIHKAAEGPFATLLEHLDFPPATM